MGVGRVVWAQTSARHFATRAYPLISALYTRLFWLCDMVEVVQLYFDSLILAFKPMRAYVCEEEQKEPQSAEFAVSRSWMCKLTQSHHLRHSLSF